MYYYFTFPRHLFILTFCTLLIVTACDRHGSSATPPTVPTVTVVKAKQQTVPVFFDYIGLTQSIASVDIRARVEGFLQEKGFVEGTDVKQGQMLFIIDPRPFQAALDSAQGELLSDEANADYWRVEEKRMATLLKERTIPQEQYDKTLAQKREAEAAVVVDKANVETSQLNLSYATMNAPFDGRASLKYVDVGNLVGGTEQTRLVTIVQLDPIYILFSPSEAEYLQIMTYMKADPLAVTVSLGSDLKLTFEGKIDAINNTVDVNTATVLLRALADNPKEILLPGIYVKVRLHLTEKPALLVPKQAVIAGQGVEYVYIVTNDNKVQQKIVTTGQIYQDKQVITAGLTTKDSVIVQGLQNMRSGMTVTPEPDSDKNTISEPAPEEQ